MINYDLSKIRALIFDVDGVLSANTIMMDGRGEPLRTMNIKDGYSIQLAAKMGLRMAIMTGGWADSIQERYTRLGVQDIFMRCSMKLPVYEKYLKDNSLTDEEVIYLGDDIPDYEIMQRCGCPCCPDDASIDIKEISTYVSPYPGGSGFVRDVIEQVLRTQGKWLASEEAFGW